MAGGVENNMSVSRYSPNASLMDEEPLVCEAENKSIEKAVSASVGGVAGAIAANTAGAPIATSLVMRTAPYIDYYGAAEAAGRASAYTTEALQATSKLAGRAGLVGGLVGVSVSAGVNIMRYGDGSISGKQAALNVAKDGARTAAAAAAGATAASGAGALCLMSGVAAPASPLCAIVGGAVGFGVSWFTFSKLSD